MSLFDEFTAPSRIFQSSRDVLRPSYVPERLLHREKQLKQLASIFSTALKGERPSNVLLFGKPGTGKTASAKLIGRELVKETQGRHEVRFAHVNCEVTDTVYGVLLGVGNAISDASEGRIPWTGVSTDRAYSVLRDHLDSSPRVVVVVLDEVDRLVKRGGGSVLYQLSRINEDLKRSSLSMICISNDLKFQDDLDARVVSSLGSERTLFPPYNGGELRDILKDRADLAFREGSVASNILSLCSAQAAQEHGDARRALELLRVAAEIAERNAADEVTEDDVYAAKNTIESDMVAGAIRTLPKHSRLVLLSIVLRGKGDTATTGDVYETYRNLCKRAGIGSLTQRRVADFISELELLGLIRASVRSFGRGGRTRVIQPTISTDDAIKVLDEDELLRELRKGAGSQSRFM
ncbi:MAG TPA: AAA family ATPase [Thermoplasmata archaeon]|nr:AAA family ATPase [Thermoplasmata archaeon]